MPRISKTIFYFFILLCSLAISAAVIASTHSSGSINKSASEFKDPATINLSGIVKDSHNEPIQGAEVKIYLNQKLNQKIETSDLGKYVARITLEKENLAQAKIKVQAGKTSFQTKDFSVQATHLPHEKGHYYHSQDLQLERVIGPAFWIAAVVFVLTYILIAFELLHRTIAAMLGAALMLLISYTLGTLDPSFHILSYEAAISSIDMNVIFLLMGMMIIVGVLKHTGVFQWCAYFAYKLAKGKVFLLTVYLIIFTAVTSAFLDNVTTMLLLTGVAIEICVALSLNPLHLLMPVILASNIGGTATLIGDPPNILIGSYSGLSFLSFVTALAPLCLITLFFLVIYTKLVWGRDYAAIQVENIQDYIQELKKKYQVTDSSLLAYGLGVLGFVILLFLSESYWHMEVSVAALFGASILATIAIVTNKVNLIELIEKDIEWPTLMFFIFLFMLVGAVESTGLLALVADWILKLSKGDFVAACTFILWVAAIMSAFVDNIPFTATMLPIVAYLSQVIPGAENTLWWALALGACFGGNGTIIGASANVVTVGIAEARGFKTTFGGFMKTAFPFMVFSVVLAQIWLILVRPA